MTAIALGCEVVSRSIVIGGKNPVESVLLAIFVGLLIRNFLSVPKIFLPGINAFEKILAAGIVLLGLSLSLTEVVNKATGAVGVVLVCLLIAPALIYYMGKWAGLPMKLATLIGLGTTICGGTAIAIVAPIIDAEDSDVSYSIATIALFGLAAIFIYPLLGNLLHLTPSQFGIWAGSAIHSTSQVVAAGFLHSEVAGQVATLTKLFRNIFILPAVLFLAYRHLKQSKQKLGKAIKIREIIPWFLYGFLLFVILRTLGDHLGWSAYSAWTDTLSLSKTSAKFLILVASGGIGLRSDVFAMRKIGMRPFLVGLSGSILLGMISLSLILFVF